MIYIASPYSHPLFLKREERYKQTMAFCARLINEGKVVFSPIVHNHQIAFFHDLPTVALFWQTANEAMIRLSSTVLVLKLDGWETSIGVAHEIDFATGIGKPVVYSNA